MKILKEFLSFLVISLLFSCNSDSNEKVSQVKEHIKINSNAVLTFENKTVDFGNIKQGEILEAVYNFKNTGTTELIIEYVNPDCICTSFYLTSDSIKADEKGVIKLILDTKDKIGSQKIFAVVKANTQTKFYRLLLKAKVY